MDMRSEDEMLALILSYANDREDIRAVVLNGSRANPRAPKDPFQDYDIVYYVRDVQPYRRSSLVPPAFGEIMILQLPDDMGESAKTMRDAYCYLMQFMDGTRIDLTFTPLSHLGKLGEDSLTAVLLDKDGAVPPLPPASDSSYWAKPPTRKQFDDCCNEFWWLNPYVSKGLWRGELTNAHGFLDEYLRPELMKMLGWYTGLRTGFQQSPGKLGKYLRSMLEPELWSLLEATYAGADLEQVWDALFKMDGLFRITGRSVAAHFGYTYPEGEDERVSAFIRKVKWELRIG